MSDGDYVLELCEKIGYGNMMHLASSLWRAMLDDNLKGGEFVVGPCRVFTVPCECESPKDCDICCGTGRVTKGASAMQSELQALRKVAKDYKNLLLSMSRRGSRIDPVWMEKYAKQRLAELESNQ